MHVWMASKLEELEQAKSSVLHSGDTDPYLRAKSRWLFVGLEEEAET